MDASGSEKERGSSWDFVQEHQTLVAKLEAIEPRRCIRMMGTMIGACGSVDRREPQAPRHSGHPPRPGELRMPGLFEQTARHLYSQPVRSLLLIGSRNRAVPIDQAPYHFYTYLFVSRVATRLVELLQKGSDEYPKAKEWDAGHQLVIQFTFVPEDILFAQFFYDEDHLVIAATYSWNTLDELQHLGAYAAVYLDNQNCNAVRPDSGEVLRFAKTSSRLVKIFDARFREEAQGLGQETWTLKRLNNRDWGVLAETPFWREGESVLRAFEFGVGEKTSGGAPKPVEMGPNMLQRFMEQIEEDIGPGPRIAPGG